MKLSISETPRKSPKSTTVSGGIAIWMDRLGRLFLILLILCAIVFCINTAQKLREPSRTSQLSSENDDLLLLKESLASMLNGDWQFAAIPWSVQVKELPTAEASTRMAYEVAPLCVLPGSSDKDISDKDIVVQVLDLLSPVKSKVGANVCYSIDNSEFNLRGFAPASMPRQVQLVRATKVIDTERSTFIELTRRNSPSDQADSISEQMLPRNSADRILASRWDADGRLCAELVELGSDVTDLVEAWKKAGWKVLPQNTPSERGDSISDPLGDQSLNLSTQEVFLCRNGSQSIYAVTTMLPNNSRSMLLIRITSDK